MIIIITIIIIFYLCIVCVYDVIAFKMELDANLLFDTVKDTEKVREIVSLSFPLSICVFCLNERKSGKERRKLAKDRDGEREHQSKSPEAEQLPEKQIKDMKRKEKHI